MQRSWNRSVTLTFKSQKEASVTGVKASEREEWEMRTELLDHTGHVRSMASTLRRLQNKNKQVNLSLLKHLK